MQIFLHDCLVVLFAYWLRFCPIWSWAEASCSSQVSLRKLGSHIWSHFKFNHTWSTWTASGGIYRKLNDMRLYSLARTQKPAIISASAAKRKAEISWLSGWIKNCSRHRKLNLRERDIWTPNTYLLSTAVKGGK